MILAALLFQNCGKVEVSKKMEDFSSKACGDLNQFLFIQDGTRVSSMDTGYTVGESVDLKVFRENENHEIEAFTPADPSTEWPPRWYKNESFVPPSQVEFRSSVSTRACEGDLFTAKFMACNQEIKVNKRFFTGT
jgi:hypothetical protein